MMKRQINSFFFLAGMLVFALALTSCGGTSQEGSETATEEKQEPAPQSGGISAYSIRIVKTIPQDTAKVLADGACTTPINCYSMTAGDDPTVIHYCSTNSTAAAATLVFYINGQQVTTGPAPVSTDGTPSASTPFRLGSTSITSLSYSVQGSNSAPTAVTACPAN